MKGQEVIVIDDIESEEKDLITPPKKKLKQARLPFQVITPTLIVADPKISSLPVANLKKRRLSGDSDDVQLVKIVKNDYAGSPTESKENLCKGNIVKEDASVQKELEDVVESSESAQLARDAGKELTVILDDTKNQSVKNVTTAVVESNDPSISVTTVSSAIPVAPKLSTPVEGSRAENKKNDKSINASEDVLESNPKVGGTDDEDFKIPAETVLENTICQSGDSEEADGSKLDESNNETELDIVSSSSKMTTPKQKSSAKMVSETTPTDRKLIPRQQQKSAGSSTKKEEREKQKAEREKLKEQKQKEKQEKEDQKKKEKELKEEQRKKEKEEKEDQKKKEKEEKEDQKKKEKEEKDKKKQAEIEMKNEEKRAKDEEKRKKELAEEGIKSKAAQKFTSFFVAKKSDSKPAEEVKLETVDNQNFKPFQIKVDMKLAPLVRTTITDRMLMENDIKEQSTSALYLSELKGRCISTSGKTWPLSEFKNDVVILEADVKIIEPADENMILEPECNDAQVLRAKLIQFHENRRPPYWGTWRKKSRNVRPTFPFGKDDKLFDYDVDSDDEWEEEEPGESLHGSDDEKESVDDYEIDNDFFVPHGYLSDEENEDQEEEVMSPETQKAKLKVLELEFEQEMKHKTERIKPRLLGCIWANNHQDIAGTQLMKLLNSRRAVFGDDPVKMPAPGDSNTPNSPGCLDASSGTPLTAGSSGIKRIKLPDGEITSLIKLIHCNQNSCAFLCKEFAAFFKNSRDAQGKESTESDVASTPGSGSPGSVVSIRSISNKIKDIANWMPCLDEGPISGRMCWYVAPEVRSNYGLADLPSFNAWKYILKPRRNTDTNNTDANVPTLNPASTPKLVPLITNFTKTVTPEERKKQMLQTANSKLTPVVQSEPSMKKSLITKFTKFMSTEELQHQLKQSVANKAGSAIKPVDIAEKSAGVAKSQTVIPRKRASILVSVPRGQEIPSSSKNLMDRYVTTAKDQSDQVLEVKGDQSVETKDDTDDCDDLEDDCILLSD